jgi:hypothetical protein
MADFPGNVEAAGGRSKTVSGSRRRVRHFMYGRRGLPIGLTVKAVNLLSRRKAVAEAAALFMRLAEEARGSLPAGAQDDDQQDVKHEDDAHRGENSPDSRSALRHIIHSFSVDDLSL